MIVTVKVELPEGYELASDRLRRVIFGDWYVTEGKVCKWCEQRMSSREYVIVRPVWQWPPWLKAAAIVKNAYGEWKACRTVPELCLSAGSGWDEYGTWVTLYPELFDFTPPPCDDWHNSLRVNPNWRET